METLTIVLSPDEEDGGYCASVNEMPGTHSQGDTIPEALKNIAEAIELAREE